MRPAHGPATSTLLSSSGATTSASRAKNERGSRRRAAHRPEHLALAAQRRGEALELGGDRAGTSAAGRRPALHADARGEHGGGVRAEAVVGGDDVAQRACPTSRCVRTSSPTIGVGLAERRAANDEPLGEVGGRRRLAVGRGLHALGHERRRVDHPADRDERQRDLVDGVEQRLLVLLQVAVVGQRQALQRRQQAGEVADQAARLAAGELGDVGVLLLRHHRRPGGVGVVEAGEAELLARPQHPLLAEPGEVDADEGEVEQRLGDEVAVADRRRASWRTRRRSRAPSPSPPGRSAATCRPAPRRRAARRRGARRWRRGGRRRGRTPSRGPAGGGPAAPAGPAGRGCSRGGTCRRRPRRGRAGRPAGRRRGGPRPSSSRLHHSRRSVATWSLRLRAVWILAPAAPASSVTRRSTAVWMSSSLWTNSNVSVASSCSTLVEGGEDCVDLDRPSAARRAAARRRGRASRRCRRATGAGRTAG